MLTYNLATAVLGLCAAAVIIVLIRRNALYTRFSFWWLAVAAALLVLGFFPGLSDILAKLFGVGYPPTLIFAAAIVLLLVKMLFMDLERSDQELRIRRLTQKLALFEERLERRDEKGNH